MGEIPKSLNIGGHEITITIGGQDKVMDVKNIRGQFDTLKMEIEIYSDMSESMQLQTICHESIHALIYAAQLNDLPEGIEEKLCHSLENHLFRFLADNDLTFFRPTPPAVPKP